MSNKFLIKRKQRGRNICRGGMAMRNSKVKSTQAFKDTLY